MVDSLGLYRTHVLVTSHAMMLVKVITPMTTVLMVVKVATLGLYKTPVLEISHAIVLVNVVSLVPYRTPALALKHANMLPTKATLNQ